MTLAYYMNENIPRPITTGIRLRNMDVLTAQEDDKAGDDDATVFDRAVELGRVLVSFDADMVRQAVNRQHEGRSFAGLIFGHPDRLSVGECIRDLEIIAKTGEPADLADQIIYLPL